MKRRSGAFNIFPGEMCLYTNSLMSHPDAGVKEWYVAGRICDNNQQNKRGFYQMTPEFNAMPNLASPDDPN